MNGLTLKAYMKQVRTVQWVICAIPLGGRFISSKSAFLSPPVGDETAAFCSLAIILAAIAAVLPWYWGLPKARSLSSAATFLVLLISLLVYFHMFTRFVVSVPVADGTRLSVSVGKERSAFSKQYFAGCTDFEMLRSRGPFESEVKKLWTEDSIDRVRLLLFVSYSGCLISLNFLVGTFAKTNADREAK